MINAFHKIHLKKIDSTNTFLKSYAKDCAVSPIVVTTDEQTVGRGQTGRKWQSKKGVNMTFSVGINTKMTLDTLYQVSFITALSLVDFLAQFKVKAKIKWPNDIFVSDSKIAGILIENIKNEKGDWISIIGIGLNINQTEFDLKRKVTSLKKLTEQTYNLNELLDSYCSFFSKNLNNFKQNPISLFNRYHTYIYKLNRIVCIEYKGEILNTLVKGIDSNSGKIILQLENNPNEKQLFDLGSFKWVL